MAHTRDASAASQYSQNIHVGQGRGLKVIENGGLAPGVGFEPTRPRGPTAVLVQLRQHVLKINAFCIVLRDIDADYAIGHLTIT